MDDPTLIVTSAALVAFTHTVVGVDHTLPFIVLGRAQRWSLARTLVITALCGLGHVAASMLLALGAIGLGMAAESVLELETQRGGIASWVLIAFGLGYAAWAVWRTLRQRRHEHPHAHADGTLHIHEHDHQAREHRHVHASASTSTVTAAGLFVLFVLGPCEFLVGPLMAAAAFGWQWVALLAAVFSSVTLATMVGVVALGHAGLGVGAFRRIERHMHAIAGLMIAASGVAIQVLGV